MNIIIIGSNGFIGSHLVSHLTSLPEHHVILSDLAEKAIQQNLAYQYHTVQSLYSNSSELFHNCDVIYYLASASIPATTWHDPFYEIDHNLIPFLKFMDLACAASVKKVVFVSSAGTIYGPSTGKIDETADKHPFSPYGITKLAMENFLNYYHIKHGINFDVFRISNVFGEGQNTKKGLGVINTFIEDILEKKEVNVYGDGENIRNYIYVKDVVKLLMHSVTTDLKKSDVYNLASNDNISINELIAVLTEVIPYEFKVNYNESRKSDNSMISLDNSKIIKHHPEFSFVALKEAVSNIHNFIKQQGKK